MTYVVEGEKGLPQAHTHKHTHDSAYEHTIPDVIENIILHIIQGLHKDMSAVTRQGVVIPASHGL